MGVFLEVFQCEIMVTSSKGVKNDRTITAPDSIRDMWEIQSRGTLRLGHIDDEETPHYVSIHDADSGGGPSSVSIEVRNKGKEAEFLEQLFDPGLDEDDFNGYLPTHVRAKARWEQGKITGFRLEGTDKVYKRGTAWHEVPAKLPQSWMDGLAGLVRKALGSSAKRRPGQDGWSVGHHSAVASGAEKKPAFVRGKGAGGEGSAETKDDGAHIRSDRSAVPALEQPTAVASSSGAASPASKQMPFAAGFVPNPVSACTLNALVLVLFARLSSEPHSFEKEEKLAKLEQMRTKVSAVGDIELGELYGKYMKPLSLGWELRAVDHSKLIPILNLKNSYGPGAMLLVTPADGVQDGLSGRGHTFALELGAGGLDGIIWNPGRFNPGTCGRGVYAGSFPLVKNELDNVYNDRAWKESGYLCWTGNNKRSKMYQLTKAQGKKKSQNI